VNFAVACGKVMRMKRPAKVYEYSNCSTCKNALKYLDQKKVSYVKVPIVETPPSLTELKRMLELYDGQIGKLFNTSGQVYREMGLGTKLKGMTEAEALRLLSENGKLVKRPFILTEKGGAVGFKEAEWKEIY
jgi:Spx/MgsR family transcriptional regulator